MNRATEMSNLADALNDVENMTEVVEHGVSTFVANYGEATKLGRALSAGAAVELNQLAMDIQLLKAAVARTISAFRP